MEFFIGFMLGILFIWICCVVGHPNKLKEVDEKRSKERNKLLKIMLTNKSEKEIEKQYKKFEKAHENAIKAYKDWS